MKSKKGSSGTLEKFKKHPAVIIVLVIASVVVGLGSLTESIDNIENFYKKQIWVKGTVRYRSRYI